jgi:hypothetical protein
VCSVLLETILSVRGRAGRARESVSACERGGLATNRERAGWSERKPPVSRRAQRTLRRHPRRRAPARSRAHVCARVCANTRARICARALGHASSGLCDGLF